MVQRHWRRNAEMQSVTPGRTWRRQPRDGCAGRVSSTDCAPHGTKGLSWSRFHLMTSHFHQSVPCAWIEPLALLGLCEDMIRLSSDLSKYRLVPELSLILCFYKVTWIQEDSGTVTLLHWLQSDPHNLLSLSLPLSLCLSVSLSLSLSSLVISLSVTPLKNKNSMM